MAVMSSSSSKRKGNSPSSFSKQRKKPKFNNTNNSKEKKLSSSQQKRALKHERQSHRTHAETVTAAKEIWNKLRLKTNTPEQTEELMNQLMDLLKDKVNQVALQHDASRVVQAAIQFGSPQQRKEICMELCNEGNLPELCKVQYAHFCVLKLIKYCHRDDECVRAICKALKGSMPKLAVHAVGARVVELLFSTLPTRSTAPLKQEFYGPHFSLFASGDQVTSSHTLASNIESAPDKKEVTLEFVVGILNKAIEKGLFGFVYFQQLFAEYVDVASPNQIQTICPSVVDHSIHMLSTRAGTRVVAACASYGSAKDRKRIAKSLKGYTRSSLLHRDAYLAILRLCQVTDDTVSIHKMILAELLTTPKDNDDDDKSPLLEIALHDTGSRFFLMLLTSDDEERLKYLDPYERQVLVENPTILVKGEKVPTSKKNAETRRKELVNYLRKPLIEMCTMHASELLHSLPGSRVLRQTYAAFAPPELVDAVVSVCVDELDSKEAEETTLFEDPVGHFAIKNLLLCDVDDEKALFANVFYDKMESRLMDIAKSNRGAFVTTALCKVEATRERAIAELSKHKAELKKLAKTGKATAGYNALLQEIAGKAKR